MSVCGCVGEVITRGSTQCVCESPGFCDRHKCMKPRRFHELCKTRHDYFLLWEKGNGPGQFQEQKTETAGTRVGLGDVIGWLASLIGVKPWPGCGCDKRKAWLNRFIVWGWWRAA
jgi:hypothetical protein